LHFGAEAPLAEQFSSSYVRDIRGIVRAFWNGTLDYDQAWGLFQDTVRIGLTRAWYEGAAECGIQPSELTDDERYALQGAIYTESGHIAGFLEAIEAGSKANGGALAPLLSRAGMWGNRYLDVTNRAKLMACGNQKMRWDLGPTKDHCESCLKLNGKVKRASQWDEADIRPQSPRLKCGGYRCLCTLTPTDEPMSKGPLPRI
jgi:hypothetical protein